MATIKTVSKMIAEYKSKGVNVRLRAAGKKVLNILHSKSLV